MADKTSWTEPLDSARCALEFVTRAGTRATASEVRRGARWCSTGCTDERVVVAGGGFDYDRCSGTGQCVLEGRAHALRGAHFGCGDTGADGVQRAHGNRGGPCARGAGARDATIRIAPCLQCAQRLMSKCAMRSQNAATGSGGSRCAGSAGASSVRRAAASLLCLARLARMP